MMFNVAPLLTCLWLATVNPFNQSLEKTVMNNLKLTTIAGLLLTGFSANTLAAAADVALLDEKIEMRIQQLQAVGFLATSLEVETIAGDIVDEEVSSTDMTVAQAVETYQLTPTLERYLQKKAAGRLIVQSGAGGVAIPPQ